MRLGLGSSNYANPPTTEQTTTLQTEVPASTFADATGGIYLLIRLSILPPPGSNCSTKRNLRRHCGALARHNKLSAMNTTTLPMLRNPLTKEPIGPHRPRPKNDPLRRGR